MVHAENGANVSECLHDVTFVTSKVILCFAPWATGPIFGSRDSIGSLKGQSEMTLYTMLSDPNSLDLIIMILHKNPKNSDPGKFAVIILKFEHGGFASKRCTWNGKQCRS